ncbi:MAG: GAF domain-containing sensor histidine kinase [Chloroflexota bacterium]
MPLIEPAVLLLLLLGVPYLVIIGIGFHKTSLRESKGRSLVLTAALSLLGTTGYVGLRSDGFTLIPDPVLERALLYGAPFLMLAFVELTRAFLRLEGIRLPWLALDGVWLLSLVVFHENLLGLREKMWIGLGWRFERPLLTTIAAAVGWGLFVLRAGILTIRSYRQTRGPLHRNRLRFWFLVVAVSAVTGALICGGRDLSAAGLHLLGLVVAAYALLRHDLLDLLHTIRQTLGYLIVTLVTAAIYASGFLIAPLFFHSYPAYSPVLAALIAALVLAAVIGPLQRGTQWLAYRLISGRPYDPAGIVRQYSMRISNILELKELAGVAMGLIGDVMQTRRGALLVVHRLRDEGDGDGARSDGVRFRGVMGTGDGHVPPHTMSEQSPVVRWLERERRPLTQYDVDLLPGFEELSVADRRWLADLDMDVYVPIYAQDEWIGLLAVGPKISGESYFGEDLTLLSTLADQTAVALENARLFADLKRQNAENERLNEELVAANRELARLDQAKSDFIDIASHELRTPLTEVRGYNDILEEMLCRGSLTTEAGLQMTVGVREAAERLEYILDTMFDVAQFDAEVTAVVKTPVAVGSVVRTVLKEWEKALRERDLSVTTGNLVGLPTIVADSEGLRKVLSNLVHNAIKYTPDGGSIHIEGRAIGTDGPREERAVEVVVSDTGIGIAPENLERIFDRFSRLGNIVRHSTRKTEFKGAGPGLGLATARNIVEAHGGRIWAESLGHDEERCPGAEFHVLLPVEDPVPDGSNCSKGIARSPLITAQTGSPDPHS